MFWQKVPPKSTDAAYLAELRTLWAAVTQQHTAAHLKYGFHSVQVNRGLGALMAYLRKYLAKEDSPDHDHPYRGRRWATSRGLPTNPYIRVDLSRKQATEVRRFAKRLLRSRFRSAKDRSKRVAWMTGGESLTLYATWETVLRFLYDRGISINQIPGDPEIPWDKPDL